MDIKTTNRCTSETVNAAFMNTLCHSPPPTYGSPRLGLSRIGWSTSESISQLRITRRRSRREVQYDARNERRSQSRRHSIGFCRASALDRSTIVWKPARKTLSHKPSAPLVRAKQRRPLTLHTLQGSLRPLTARSIVRLFTSLSRGRHRCSRLQ